MKSFDRGGLLILSFLLVIMTGLSVPGGAPAAAGDAEGSAGRPAWEEGISYLLGMLTAKENSLDAAKVSGLLDFALAERGAAPTMKPADREGATGAYFFTDVKAPLSKVIRYAYNPRSRPTSLSPRWSASAAGRPSRAERRAASGKRSGR